MKLLLTICVFLSCTSLFALNLDDFQIEKVNSTLFDETKSIELIVSFENLSPKQYEELELVLSSLVGFHNNGHCERMNVFYLSYDSNMYRTAEEAFDALQIKTKPYQPLLKIGATVADVQRECNK